MPRYEVYADDGTLLVRCRRGDDSKIPAEELMAMALNVSPDEDMETFRVVELDAAEYIKSLSKNLQEGSS